MHCPLRPARTLGVALAIVAALAAVAVARAREQAPRDSAAARRAPAPARAAAIPAAVQDSAGPKRLYIAADDHTDYMWSGDDAYYAEALPRMLDEYMFQADSTRLYPSNQRGRFNADGTLWVWAYEHSRTPEEVRRLWDHVRAGTLTVPLNTCVQLWGAMPTEAVLRSLYYAGQLERREDVSLPLLVPMENETLPGGVASLWAGAGALYAWKGVCNCTAPTQVFSRPREIYRFTGPDGQSVLLKWNSSLDGNQSIGGYAEARDPYHAVAYMDSDVDFLARWPWPVAAAFGYGWDDPESYTTQLLHAAHDLTDSTRTVIVSNELDFFRDFEATCGAQVPSWGGSLGNDWDLLPASLAATTAGVKRSLEKLRTAEALGTVATLFDRGALDGLQSARDSMNLACGLYYEHNWSAGPAVTEPQRLDWQRRIAAAIDGYVDLLHDRALARVASLVPAPAGAERHLVFNPLSWPRTDVVDLAVSLPPPYHVVDLTDGHEVPCQPMVVNGRALARILASDVPSVGYRVYQVMPGPPAPRPDAAQVSGATADNGVVAVTLGARGEIASLVDHRDGDRELVAPGAALLDLGSGSGAVQVESTGPVSTTLAVQAGGSPAHEARVTLYAGLDRVDYSGLVTDNFSGTLGYQSTFAYTAPKTHHEEVGMIAWAARQAQGGDYADQDTRTDWLTLNHFVDLSEDARGVTLSASDSPFFQLGNSTPGSLDAGSAQIETAVGFMGSGPDHGIFAQGGDAGFRADYALRTHGAYDPAAAMRFALEHQDPLIEARVTGGPTAPLPEEGWSLLSIDSPDVVLWALKPAEEGITGGIIARAWNLADAPRSATLSLTGVPLLSAASATHVEVDLGPAPTDGDALPMAFARQQLRTWRLTPGIDAGVPVGRGAASGLAAYPNPVHAGVPGRVAFALAAPARARVTVIDVRGARVATLADGPFGAGAHALAWDARGLAPGVYFVRLESGGRAVARRVVVLD